MQTCRHAEKREDKRKAEKQHCMPACCKGHEVDIKIRCRMALTINDMHMSAVAEVAATVPFPGQRSNGTAAVLLACAALGFADAVRKES